MYSQTSLTQKIVTTLACIFAIVFLLSWFTFGYAGAEAVRAVISRMFSCFVIIPFVIIAGIVGIIIWIINTTKKSENLEERIRKLEEDKRN